MSKKQVLDYGIRQKINKNSELVHCLQCLLPGATKLWAHGLRKTIACIQVKRHNGTPCVACWQGSRQNTNKSECAFRCSPIGRSKKFLVFIRPPMQTGYIGKITSRIPRVMNLDSGKLMPYLLLNVMSQIMKYMNIYMLCIILKISTKLEKLQVESPG